MTVWLAAPSARAAAGVCPNEAFRVGSSAALPDCRAYEMVSPSDKNGGEVDGGVHKGAMVAPEQAAADGEAVTYASTSAFLEAQAGSAVVSSQYLSTRTPSGWQTRAIVPTQQLPEGRLVTLGEGVPDFSLFQGFSEDLGVGFLLAWNPQPDSSAPAGYFNPYLLETSAGSYRLLSEGVTPPVQSPGQGTLEGPTGFGAVYAGASVDGEHVIFEANDALTPAAAPGKDNLYEWSYGRPLELVSVLPEGETYTSGTRFLIGNSQTLAFGAPGDYEMPDDDGAISNDGMRAFWSGTTATGYQLYMHEITSTGARTVEVSASQNPAVASGAAPVLYQAANPQGSRVYFTSTAKLTTDSTASAGAPDLYRYDVESGLLSDLTVDANAGEAADVQGVLGIGESRETPYVYFVAHGVLAAGASAGANNLYVLRDGTTQFVSTLGNFVGEAQDYAFALKQRTARVSPDGQLLAFQSAQPLTGYDNVPANGTNCPVHEREGDEKDLYREPPEGRCMEVFEYSAQTATLVCVSCERNGLPPTGDSLVPETPHLYENARGWESSTVQQRYLLDNGRLFFESEDTLLPQATNGRQNIYEYEPEGVGQCSATGGGGCLYLISTGESSGNAFFLDASADGRDVFLLTQQQLVPQDGDDAIDVYDAREGGGFSAAQPPPCTGEACKPAVTPAPEIYGAPASATFQGDGNLAAQPEVKQDATGKKAKQRKRSKKRKKSAVGSSKRRKKAKAKQRGTHAAANGPAGVLKRGRR